ncbi:MAG: hypothetical protein U5N86_06890 [Planctomycetota bacterium]|nr:hypothetical protein [Planctomycetota bacterium]
MTWRSTPGAEPAALFSGDSERDDKGRISDKLALLWWRRKLEGDFTFEMYFGIKMSNDGGRKYNYARDINVALVSDTTDLSSGYNFILGGKEKKSVNAGSWILRNNQRVPTRPGDTLKRSRFRLYTSSSHRFWFHYILKRRGNNYTLILTDQKGSHEVFDYTDPDPMPADRLGDGTYDCGIMLSRVRIQTEGFAPMIDVTKEKDGRPDTIYDDLM